MTASSYGSEVRSNLAGTCLPQDKYEKGTYLRRHSLHGEK